MRYCLHTYGYKLAHNGSRLWRLRRDAAHIACLRVTSRYREPLPTLVKLQGVRNVEVSQELWWGRVSGCTCRLDVALAAVLLAKRRIPGSHRHETGSKRSEVAPGASAMARRERRSHFELTATDRYSVSTSSSSLRVQRAGCSALVQCAAGNAGSCSIR
jgi:hypothetical protein